MHGLNDRLRHQARCWASVLLAGGIAVSAHADKGVETMSVTLQADTQSLTATSTPFRGGVVTAANPYGAEAGAKILEQGGNAIDAAVAITYALNVVEPQSAGVGGGGFMMIYLASTRETFFIDTREKAPAGATPDMFVGVPNATLQGVAVGVPGMVRGTALAVERFGNLKLSDVIQPAIKLADEGFAATPRYTAVSCNNGGRSTNSPEAAAYFCPNGQPAPVGSLVQNKPLAQTFRLIAANGPDCFYKLIPALGCDIAKGIVEGQKFNRPQAPNGKGGTMTYADLENYQAIVRAPVVGTYRGYVIKSVAPPTSGGLTILQMLKMLERFPLGDAAQGYGFGSLKTANVMSDAMRLAFADRSIWLGDPDFVSVPGKGLLNSTYVGQRSALIVPGARINPNPQPGDPRPFETAGLTTGTRLAVAEPVTGPGETTTHYSVVDKWGNMVTYTNTIESSHGIGVFAGYTENGSFHNFGFLLNNELTDFNTTPSINPYTGSAGYNDVQPNKRPRSSMSPTMIFTPEGEPLVAYGSPGGATIINSVLNVTLNLIDHKMTLQDAINAPRLSITSTASSISLEPGYPQSTIDGLRTLGYTVGVTTPGGEIGSVQAVLVDPATGYQYGAADSRREGTVIGLPRPTYAVPTCAGIQAALAGKAVGVLCFHSDDLTTHNSLTTPANNSITTFADGTPLPGLLAGANSFTPITDRGVISNGPTPSTVAVPGIQVEGWFATDPTKQARFVLRFPDVWNGRLVVAGASGTRSEYNGDWAWSDYVLPKGYAYASANKGVLNLYLVSLASATQPASDPLACRLNPDSQTWVHFYDNDPPKTFIEWGKYMVTTTTLAQATARAAYGASPQRTYGVGTSNGGYQVRRAMELLPSLFDGGVDWEGTYVNPNGPNILIDLPPAIKNFPAYVASNYDPNSPAAQAILAAGYPPDIVNRSVSPPDSMWGRYSGSFWEVTACQWQERFDPTYATYTAGLGNYNYLGRIGIPGVFPSVAAVTTTGKIAKPLITVAGTMDALLPIQRQARAYEAAVNSNNAGPLYRLYEVQNGNHIESYVNFYPQLQVIQPHAQRAFDLLVDHVESSAPLPASQCIPKGGAISSSPAQSGHCSSLFVP